MSTGGDQAAGSAPPGTVASEQRPATTYQQPQSKQQKELRVEDALLYLDQVKMEFTDKPHIYNQFLEIMKDFKAEKIKTPEVIELVKNLFRGYNKLILGFNRFLPDGEGYKIELTDEEAQAAPASRYSAASSKPPLEEPAPSSSLTSVPSSSATAGSASSAAAGADGQGASATSSKPQQFQQRNAINYVTKIRNRFQNEQATYQAFLKILYKYQQDQKGIKDVLEQVSQLFGDHPDLLDEFAQFLPDGVQEQARERLSRAAKEAEQRKQMMRFYQGTGQGAGGKRGARDGKVPQLSGQARKHAAMMAQQAQLQAERKHQRRRMEGDDRRKDQYSHIPVTAERQFFDQIKDCLTASSRESWSEFVKVLDLFASDSITKRELFAYVSDLLGPNQDLYDEFTRLMASRADYEAQGSDVWYAIPLSEIDFSQCRKCTPSYRALPKDYPRPQCTERSEEEQRVLNDQWVSIPIGSEESNSFKHMRKNQYEEALFKCEDDRFEIDLIIDSNMCTIRMLEPIAEEISNIKGLEESGDGSAPRFSFQLEKRNLSTIHLNSIARLYGDHGNEILELLRKNPAGTIPILLKRLRLKDLEWRKARQDLNRQWKEVLERNWEKSFDHRSFYFKQDATKNYSSKHLLSEIKGNFSDSKGGEAHDTAPCVSTSVPSSRPTTDTSPRAAKSWAQLLGDMQPQLVMSFSNAHHSVHKDIYKIVCYAVESANISPVEKEKIMALWRDLVRVFFNLPVHYLYGEMQKTTTLEKTVDSVPLHPTESWAVGTRVVTIYGSGSVLQFRPQTSSYAVKLPFGTAFVKASSIIGAEALSPAALLAVGVTTQENGSDKIFGGLTGAKGAPKVAAPSRVFLGTQVFYLFFRLHHTLFCRLSSARELVLASAKVAAERQSAQSLSGGLVGSPVAAAAGGGGSSDAMAVDAPLAGMTVPASTHPLAHLDADDEEGDSASSQAKQRPSYPSFLGHLSSLVDGTIDSAKYEEACRVLLGNRSFVVYTLDKLLQHLVVSLQKMVNDDNVPKLVGLFVYQKSRAGAEGGVDAALYHQHCAALLNSSEELFRFQLMAPVEGLPATGDTLVGIQVLPTVDHAAAAAAAGGDGSDAMAVGP